MLSQIYWHTPNRVLVLKFTGTLNLDDPKAVKSVMDTVLSQTDAEIHFILDARARDHFDPQLYKLHELIRRLSANRNWIGKPGWILAIDSEPNPIMNVVSSVISQLLKTQFRVYKSMDEALALLNQTDGQITPTLPTDPENLLERFTSAA